MEFIAKEFSALSGAEVYEILKSRSEVFMLEQKILCLDMDNVDYKSHHLFLKDGNRVVAYLRAIPKDGGEVVIGRVLTLCHGKGLGRTLMEQSLKYIKENLKAETVCLHSQVQALGFYKKFGFKTTSEEFLEEGVPHVTMKLT